MDPFRKVWGKNAKWSRVSLWCCASQLDAHCTAVLMVSWLVRAEIFLASVMSCQYNYTSHSCFQFLMQWRPTNRYRIQDQIQQTKNKRQKCMSSLLQLRSNLRIHQIQKRPGITWTEPVHTPHITCSGILYCILLIKYEIKLGKAQIRVIIKKKKY